METRKRSASYVVGGNATSEETKLKIISASSGDGPEVKKLDENADISSMFENFSSSADKQKRSASLTARGKPSVEETDQNSIHNGMYGIDGRGDGPEVEKHNDESSDISPMFGNFPSPSKRQKVDKDGFLTPATPDIPLQSIHREPKTRQHDSVDSLPEDIKQTLENGPEKCNQSDIVQSSEIQNDPPKNKEEPERFDVLIKYLTKESSDLCLQFVQGFSDMENYEIFCITRIQKLLEDARNLECKLIQQREQLRQRVQQLSQTLRLL